MRYIPSQSLIAKEIFLDNYLDSRIALWLPTNELWDLYPRPSNT